MKKEINTEWGLSTDIYGIRQMVEDVKKRFVDDVDEETLSIGIFGFIGDIEAKKIQIASIMTGELGNEMFGTKAKLSKNVLAHAIYQNISNINARPAEVTVSIAINVVDMERYMKNGRFVFDRTCPIFVGNYEFHFDYDVILQKSQSAAMAQPVYSARYDMTHENPISNIVSPYLNQPFLINMMNAQWVIFNATLHQTTIEWTEDKLVTASIIDNKTFIFHFTNQLAGFFVYVEENGKTTKLRPYFVGASIDEDEEYYCRYIYINDSTVRVSFDTQSWIPGLNAKVIVEAYTTLGSKGMFSFNYDDESATDFVNFFSEDYGYDNIDCYCRCQTDSVNGVDRKSMTELRKLVPKYALSRGYITTETDLNNYFNLISTDTNRLLLQKKVDNQLDRIWYAYFLLKDEFGNIVPTNTLRLEVDISLPICYACEDKRKILPAGTIFSYQRGDEVCTVVDPEDVPVLYSKEYFGDTYYYMSVYDIIINPDPLYAAFYMMTVNTDSYFLYNWVNDNCELQFITNRNNIRRKLLSEKNLYRFTFNVVQSVNADYGMLIEDEIKDETTGVTATVIENNIRCILLMYRQSEPYRYAEAHLVGYDKSNYITNWEIVFTTDNSLDNQNYLKLLDLGVAGGLATDRNYGYFEDQFDAQLFVFAKFEKELGRGIADGIIPGMDGYTLTNIYDVENGITLYKNYTNLMNTKVEANSSTNFYVSGIPLVGAHYMEDEDHVNYFLDALDDKKEYIDDCMEVVENNFDIDLKFFNTYGPALTYSIGDKKDTDIGSIDIVMKWRLCLVSASDIYTKDAVIKYIKKYIEDLNDIGDLHIPNLITEIRMEFKDAIYWIEFMNYNEFWLGVNHIILREVEDPHTVPEFINVRNTYDDLHQLIPCIEIEVVPYTTAKT